jgi:hypothetical protein
MKCKEAQEQLPEYLLVRTEEASPELRFHLASCPECRAEFEGLAAVWQKLGQLPEEEPTPAMRTRFYAMLEGYREGLEKPSPASSITFSTPWWRSLFPAAPAMQFLLAALFLVIGVLLGRLSNYEKQGNGELVQLRGELQNMRQMVTLSLLQQQSASERLAGLSWSEQVRQPDTKVLDALINALNYDPNVNVRLRAVDALHQFADRPVVRQGIVQALLRQNSPLVQIALIDLVVEIREKQSADALRRLAEDATVNQAVRQRAQWGLQRLT